MPDGCIPCAFTRSNPRIFAIMLSNAEFFKARSLLIATKHGKEQVIAPLLEAAFSLRCHTPSDYDTDLLGTFTGEIEREKDPLSTVREKAKRAAEQYNADLVLASEGSFGPHPSIFFVQADEEWLLLYDARHHHEIIVREISTQTNFNGQSITSASDLESFAAKAGFPDHRLIIRNAVGSLAYIQKGIGDWGALTDAYKDCQQKHGTVYVETDMRAIYNPTRMEVIRAATEKLIEKMKTCCPACQIPGYGIVEVLPGLLCSLCASPTRSTRAYVYGCTSCGHRNVAPFPHGKTAEDPMYCDHCNP